MQLKRSFKIVDRFEGTLSWEGKQYALDNDNIVLRGAILRNTQW
jgi:phospholipid-translocating ATPase